MKTPILFILLFGFATTILSGQNQLRGGENFIPPDGGEFIDIGDIDKLPKGVELNLEDDCYLVATRRCLYLICRDDESDSIIDAELLFCVPLDDDITDIEVIDYVKDDDAEEQIFDVIILTKKGKVYRIPQGIGEPEETDPFTVAMDGIDGDDMYAFSEFVLEVSRDNGETWQINTMGLDGARNFDIALDYFENVYLGTSKGIYMQPLTGNTWTKVTGYPLNSARLVFVDRKNNIYATTFSNDLYRSTNLGISWQPFASGITGKNVVDMDDANDTIGNYPIIYSNVQNPQLPGVRNGNEIYKSTSGTMPFVRIDQNLTAMNGQPSSEYIYTGITGETSLGVSSIYGFFVSSDQGDTWVDANKGVRSDVVYSYLEGRNGRRFATTNLGTYKLDPTDLHWSKIYPPNAYIGGQQIFKTDEGTLYTTERKLNPDDFYNSPRLVVKSTDNGMTWMPDTAGLSKIGMFRWYLDIDGRQYAAEIGFNQGSMKLYKKNPGESWVEDNLGFMTPNNDYPTDWSTDKRDRIYFATQSGTVWQRQIIGETWILDVVGIFGSIFDLASTSDHTMVAGGISGLFYKFGRGSTWMNFGLNPHTPLTTSAMVLTVDDDDYVWVGFSHFEAGFNSIGDGVYYTNDLGATCTRLWVI